MKTLAWVIGLMVSMGVAAPASATGDHSPAAAKDEKDEK